MADSKFTQIQIQIDPEFQALIPPLSDDERMLLEENLLRDSCRDPLVVWSADPETLSRFDVFGYCKGDGCRYERSYVPPEEWVLGDGIYMCPGCDWGLAPFTEVLLDGHNRYELCQKHGLAFETVSVDLPDREAAKDWIDTNQLGRRNLTPDQASLLRGRRYNRQKKAPTGFADRDLSGDQNDPREKTAEKLAAQHGVSAPTIKRDGQFAQAVETLKAHVPDIEQRVMSGDVPSKQAVVEAAKAPERAEQILRPHVANNSGNNEWYTPAEFIDAARDAMGSINTDPASSDIANQTVQADAFYSADDNGLTKPWRGNVWMNPPYAQPLIAEFAEAVSAKYEAKEIKRACVLVNNATDTAWFRRMSQVASAVCFTNGRVRFIDPGGNPSGAPLQGQAVLYMGENPHRFKRSFEELGHVWVKPE